jgi:hypothetical protein
LSRDSHKIQRLARRFRYIWTCLYWNAGSGVSRTSRVSCGDPEPIGSTTFKRLYKVKQICHISSNFSIDARNTCPVIRGLLHFVRVNDCSSRVRRRIPGKEDEIGPALSNQVSRRSGRYHYRWRRSGVWVSVEKESASSRQLGKTVHMNHLFDLNLVSLIH